MPARRIDGGTPDFAVFSRMSDPRVSVLIHTRNEERWIADCLRSAAWADEVVVADMASTDATREIVAGLGARIVDVPVAKNVDEVRNQAMEACTGDWILVVDADERVSPGLAVKVRELVRRPEADGFLVPRKNYMLDAWLEHSMWPDEQLRLFRRGSASWSGVVHEAPVIRGVIARMAADPAVALEHPGACADLAAYFQRHVKYAGLETARIRVETEEQVLIYLLRRPLAEFLGRYFRQGGWRDGLPGLVFCLMRLAYALMIGANVYAANRGKFSPSQPSKLRSRVWWEGIRTALKLLRG